MFHYLEYSYFGKRYHTRRSGPLNDLEGIGLKLHVKHMGGKVLIHVNGSRPQVQAYIDVKQDEVNDRNGALIDAE